MPSGTLGAGVYRNSGGKGMAKHCSRKQIITDDELLSKFKEGINKLREWCSRNKVHFQTALATARKLKAAEVANAAEAAKAEAAQADKAAE
jgi:hypothetical protein